MRYHELLRLGCAIRPSIKLGHVTHWAASVKITALKTIEWQFMCAHCMPWNMLHIEDMRLRATRRMVAEATPGARLLLHLSAGKPVFHQPAEAF